MSSVSSPRDDAARAERASFGMWVFLASEVLFFGVVLLAYAHGRIEWPRGFALASRHTHVILGTLNTALLLTSSATAAWAVVCAERRALQTQARRLLWVTVGLGLAFLVVKGVEYRVELREHLFPGAGFALSGTRGAALFFMVYWFATGLHALHLVAGIGVFTVLAAGLRRRREWAGAGPIDAAALYWHFVDVVWIFLYPLLYLVERHP
jgi:cytochrome c oxidase subunit 3